MKRTLVSVLYTIVFLSFNLVAQPSLTDKRDVNRIIDNLTVEQKAALLVGCTGSDRGVSHLVAGSAGFTFPIDSLGIPSVNLADGPVGVRIAPVASNIDYTAYCTCFPSTTALAATWNREVAEQEGAAIGAEAKAYGVDIVLSPGINIMRNPLCGRNFEYFSEDPYLGGYMAAAMINGIQSNGVGTSLKHFVANNQQTGKLYNDARISQRALREIYLKGFEIVLKNSNPWTVMGSYNKIGGKYTQANPELLRTVLRDEWGFDGLVMTDWYKQRNSIDQINGGTDLLMQGEKGQIDEIIEGVKNGKISEENLNNAVRNVLNLVAKSLSYNGWKYQGAPDLEAHAALAREIAVESMILLKNDSSLLPLDTENKVALFGVSAYKTIAGGTGSSNVNKPHIIDVCKGLEDAGYKLNERFKNIYGKYIEYKDLLMTKYPGCADWEKLSYYRNVIPEMDLSVNEMAIEQEAKKSDVAVIVLGKGSGEESDRREIGGFTLTEPEKYMIEKVSEIFHKQGKKVAVILNSCGVVEMESWKDCADAILMTWFPGQEGGYAIADVVAGKANPSGKLPMTFSVKYSDIPSSKNYPEVGVTTAGKNFDYTNYEEDIWVGYRYFNTADVKVTYPFGYGKSYTEFTYSNPKLKHKRNSWTAEITVTNTGKFAGKEVVQLYVSAPESALQKPSSELKAFGKTKNLQPGESETLVLTFSDYDLVSFDEANSCWLTEKGVYTLHFGASSADFRENVQFNVKRNKTWKVNNVLTPVEKVNVMTLPEK